MAVGVILPGPVASNSAAFVSLVSLLQRFGDFMFVGDSIIMLPDGTFVPVHWRTRLRGANSTAYSLRREAGRVSSLLPFLDVRISNFVETRRPRSPDEVGELEDVYYCTHNAVRSAQMGENTVPQEFYPIRDGGATDERRYALTWSLSPGTDWDDTDLST